MKEEVRLFKTLDEALLAGRETALVTIVSVAGSTPRDAGAKMLVFSDGSTTGTVGGGELEKLCIENAIEVIKKSESKKMVFDLTEKGIGMACAGRTEVFFEVYPARAKIFIAGAGHVGLQIAKAAEIAGLSYSVADDRADLACRANFPQAAAIYAEAPDTAIKADRIDEKTYIIIVTRGHSLDQECLEAAMKTKAAYIGMIGSRSKVPTVVRKLNAKGTHPEKDKRVYTPIGLELGGKAPGEIAISVLAEVLKLSYGGSGNHMKMEKFK